MRFYPTQFWFHSLLIQRRDVASPFQANLFNSLPPHLFSGGTRDSNGPPSRMALRKLTAGAPARAQATGCPFQDLAKGLAFAGRSKPACAGQRGMGVTARVTAADAGAISVWAASWE